MNKKQKKELICLLNDFPKEVDQAVIDKFGKSTKCKTDFSLIHLSYKTTFKAIGEKTKRIDDFLAGYMKGHADLAEKIEMFRQKYFNK